MYKNLYKLIINLDKKIKKKIFFIIFILFLSSVLEVIGISLIIPLISSITNTDNKFISNLPFNITNHLTKLENITVIIYVSIFIFIFFIIKNILLMAITFFLTRFYYQIKNLLDKKIYESYIYQEYSDFIKISSGKRINNITTETQSVLEGSIISIMTLISEILFLFLICSLLLFFNFKVTTMAIAILIFLTVFSLLIIKPILKKLGNERLKYYENKLDLVNQSISGIREIKLFQIEKGIKKNFFTNNDRLTKISYLHIFIQSITKFYLEIGGIFSFIFIVIFFFRFNNNTLELITLLSLYGVSIFKILPSINKIINSKNSLRFSEPSVKKLLYDLEFIKNQKINTKIFNNYEFKNKFENWKTIKFSNISFSYGSKNFAISNFDFEINKSNKIGIFGQTGVGKSTLIDLICNLIKPCNGHIIIDGKKIIGSERNEYQMLFSYLSQNIFIFNSSLTDNITLNSMTENNNINLNNLELAIKVAQLSEFTKSLDNKNETLIGEEGNKLSGGQRQRIGIARTLYSDKQILIFDEATNALDEQTEINFVDDLLINFNKKTIIFVTHNLKILKKFNLIYRLENNKIIKL
jgi:ABC-type bacteriocin/lantibiotic exporter with double-glycine peptidase domain